MRRNRGSTFTCHAMLVSLNVPLAKKSLECASIVLMSFVFLRLQFPAGDTLISGVEEMAKFVAKVLEGAITSGTLMVLRASKEFAVRTCSAFFASCMLWDDRDCVWQR